MARREQKDRMTAANAPVLQQYVPFIGGLDTATNRQAVAPGRVFGAKNYEPRVTGGYRRIGGFERFDGQDRPSDAAYTGLGATTVWTCDVEDDIVGVTSGATATVAYINDGATWMAVTDVVGAFLAGETINVSGSPVGVYDTDDEQVGTTLQNTIISAAAAVYRNRIDEVPGSGAVRGVAELDGTVYAFRDNVGGTAIAIYKSTAAGWVSVPLYYELSFNNGNGTPPAEGATITKGAVSATVKRVVTESGDWTVGSGAGRFIITQPSGGSFTTGAFTAGVTADVTATKLGTAIALSPGGSYQFDTGVFAGGTRRLYGCDGINPEFEFDGLVYVPLNTGVTSVRASNVCVHAFQVWFSYRYAVQHSAIGLPYQWTALSGSAEIDVNADITGLVSMPGNASNSALMIYSERGVHVLYGQSDASYSLTLLSRAAGADQGSIQPLGLGVSASRAGIRVVSTSERFDNFSHEYANTQIEGYTANRVAVSSMLQRSRSMYRVFFDDGTGLAGCPDSNGVMQWMPLDLGVTPAHTWTTEIDGRERIFFTSTETTGYVYEFDVGRSFDGEEIVAWMLAHPFTNRMPGSRKTFRHVMLEASGESAFALSLTAEFNYGDADDLVNPMVELTRAGGAMRWDISNWESGVWDGGYFERMRFETRGQGVAMGVSLYSASAVELPHTLHGETIHFTNRRNQR